MSRTGDCLLLLYNAVNLQSSSSSSSAAPGTSMTRSPADSSVRLLHARTPFQTAYKNVMRPTMIVIQLSCCRRSLPEPPTVRLPPKPPVPTLNHWKGESVKMNFAKPKRPSEASPFVMCSSQPVGSSSYISDPVGPPIVAIVSTGSRYKLIMGSATKPRTKMDVMKMSRVRPSCAEVLLIHEDQVRRWRWYL